jgi:3-oxosteroid 1-dehydrogenase
MIKNLPKRWDAEAEVVSLGSGIGGLAAAITAHDNGSRAMVLERTDQVGGVTALSVGEVWVAGNHLAQALDLKDSQESGFRYLRRLSMGYGDERAILNNVVHAPVALKYFEKAINLKMRVIRDCPDYYYGIAEDAVAEGRLLECLPFPAKTLGAWQPKTRVSPLVPYAMTHKDMFAAGGFANVAKWDYSIMSQRLEDDERCLGSGLVAYFVKGALDRDIPMHTGTEAVELIGDGQRVIGVRAIRDGQDVFVKANRGVVIAVSSYERNSDFNKTMGQQIDVESMVFPAIDGANFRLAGPLGARTARVPDITALGFQIPGEEQETGDPLWRSALQPVGMPHVIVVNRKGKRFGNESFYRDIQFAVDIIHGGTQTHPNFPCWAILDSQAREKYPFGSIMPGQDWPKGFGVQANSLAELASKAGIDLEGLTTTVANFNRNAEVGSDPEFSRGVHPWSAWMSGDPFNKPHPNLGTVAQAPFYAVELHRLGGSAIPAAGLVSDHHSRAISWDNKPIEGLYVAGNSAARLETGATMQSGVSNARGMTHGYLAGLHASGKASELLDKEAPRFKAPVA